MSNMNDFVIKNGILVEYKGRDANVVIPDDDSVTSLGDWCFGDCSSLTSITIPDSVTSLGDECFTWCESLKSITIPDSVTSLGNWCFGNCSSLTSITIPDSVTSLGDECFDVGVNLTIRAEEGSTAAEYAEKNGIKLELI